MSTKIYSGFKFKGSLLSFNKVLASYKKSSLLRMEEAACGYLNNMIDYTKKKMEGKNFSKDKSFKYGVDKYLEDSVVELLEDFGYFESIVFQQISETEIIGIYFGGKLETFLKEDSIEEFGYWNNTDEPEGMSDEEWSSRESTWDEFLKYFTDVDCLPVKYCGLTFLFTDAECFKMYRFISPKSVWREKVNIKGYKKLLKLERD